MDKPLLLFPKAGVADKTPQRPFPPKKINRPSSNDQGRRLTPKLAALQQSIRAKKSVVSTGTTGIQPELTLVLETVGSVDRFINAVSKVDGLYWLGEQLGLELDPDGDFSYEDDPDKQLPGRLYLLMTNRQALEQLCNLFKKWSQNPAIRFPYGLAPLRKAFEQLYDVREWNEEDRLRDTGLLEDWEFRVNHTSDAVPFEAELWYRDDETLREAAANTVSSLIKEYGGEVVQQSAIPDVEYHAVLGRLPAKEVERVLDKSDLRLLQCEGVMFLRPVGQCAVTFDSESKHSADDIEGDDAALPELPPIVALLDGLPLSQHEAIRGRLVISDPDNHEERYQAGERFHGTTMSSLICRGDLSEAGPGIQRQLFVRPILEPAYNLDGDFDGERIPETALPVDLVHRVVKELLEPIADESHAAALRIRVINLSVCDPSRPFDRSISPWARLIDWLSWKYKVLFVVSAGNHNRDIELDLSNQEFDALSPEQRETAIVRAIVDDTRHRRLLSPAESINCLSVGAEHDDSGPDGTNSTNRFTPYLDRRLPAPYSAHGPGFRRSVKPEVLVPGGRQLFNRLPASGSDVVTLRPGVHAGPPGHRVAVPGPAGQLSRTQFTRGTSNATALASRWFDSAFDIVEDLSIRANGEIAEAHEAIILKALLVHVAKWTSNRDSIEAALKELEGTTATRAQLGRFLGYGTADLGRSLLCTEQRATVVGTGDLGEGHAHVYDFPIPSLLNASTAKRWLSITLAWLSPISCSKQKYRKAHLWFEAANELAPDRQFADGYAARRGTIQHEVLHGDSAAAFEEAESISIKVNCRADADSFPDRIPYALIATLEVAENIPVYSEIRDRLAVTVPIRAT